MAAVIIQVIHSFHKSYSKDSLFISANTFEKHIVSKEYCNARHDDKMCFLPLCIYHIFVMGVKEELLQKLYAFCFNYLHVDCLYTLSKYRFSGKIVVKSGQLLDNLQRAVHFNHQNWSGQNAQHREKETLEEKLQETFVELPPKDQIGAN